MTKVEIKLNSIQKEIEKLETRISREITRNEKQIAIAKELGSYFPTFEEWVKIRDNTDLTTWSDKKFKTLYIVGVNDREIKDLSKDLNRYHDKLAKVEEIVNAEIQSLEEIRGNKIPKIEEFLDEWLSGAIKYYENKGLLTDTPNYAENEISERDLKLERDRKSDYIAYQVTRRVGKLVDTGRLEIGRDGNINGIVKGENGVVNIRTIIAGGYNIQCRHFRVLFN